MSEKLFYNAKLLTMSHQNKDADTVFVKNNKITAIGSYHILKNEVSSSCNMINLEGKVLMPSIIDAHTHFYQYAKFMNMINLSDCQSIQEISDRLYQNKDKFSQNKWIRGWGWDKNKYTDSSLMNKSTLDLLFPDQPVCLDSHDLHSKWCNSKALEIAQINQNTLDPPGGFIGRDHHGNPDGLLYELAWDLINRVMPESNQEEQLNILRSSITQCHEYGISAVNLMEGEESFLLCKTLSETDRNFRFVWHFPSEILDNVIHRKKQGIFYNNTDFIRTTGMKIFMDGSLGSKTAYMFHPYPNDPHNFGKLSQSWEKLYELMLNAGLHDIPSTVHSIGDKCSSELIKVFIRLNQNLNKKLNHRIEHLQSIRPDDISELAKSGVSCAMQSIHMKEDIAYIEKLWPQASQYAYTFKSLLDHHILFALSSDAPVETINPFEGVFSAVERRFKNSFENPSWHPEQSISAIDALTAYTVNSAKVSGISDLCGTIEVGKFADLLVIDNFFNKDSTFWLTAKSLLTMIHGDIVYQSI